MISINREMPKSCNECPFKEHSNLDISCGQLRKISFECILLKDQNGHNQYFRLSKQQALKFKPNNCPLIQFAPLNSEVESLIKRIRGRMTPYSKTMGGSKIDKIFQMEEQTNDFLINTIRQELRDMKKMNERQKWWIENNTSSKQLDKIRELDWEYIEAHCQAYELDQRNEFYTLFKLIKQILGDDTNE